MSHHPLAQMVAAGTRLTAQRQLIWDLLHQSGDHLTAEEIRARLAGRLPGLNLPTVYRTLVFLRTAGLVQELHLGEGPVRYEAPETDERHPHLVCRGCGRIEHLEAAGLAPALEAAASARGYADQEIEVVVYATCAGCAERHTPAAANE
ncbi:MAG: transcriptional repressor [Chloroflexi bacterium]|nr:transcriptional repressor [Chloroflexota bacterium]